MAQIRPLPIPQSAMGKIYSVWQFVRSQDRQQATRGHYSVPCALLATDLHHSWAGPPSCESTVSNDSAQPAAWDVEHVWQSLRRRGYAITDDESIGLPPRFRESFSRTYFDEEILRHDEGDWPIDRKRARDVIRYYWFESDLELEEHDRITITNRAGVAGDREHHRIPLLKAALGGELARARLHLVPAERRQPDGTLGVNMFRTYTNVVTSPHHDDEEFIILYVLDRIGGGAESYLYEVTANGGVAPIPVLEQQLNPGQILIFEDERFLHGATPLEPPPGETTARRDALVCTVDHRGTYLEPTPEPSAASK
jgi:hypothetical protein